MKWWECSECGTKWSEVHYGKNPYKPIKEGMDCPTEYFKKCKGKLVLKNDEEKVSDEISRIDRLS